MSTEIDGGFDHGEMGPGGESGASVLNHEPNINDTPASPSSSSSAPTPMTLEANSSSASPVAGPVAGPGPGPSNESSNAGQTIRISFRGGRHGRPTVRINNNTTNNNNTPILGGSGGANANGNVNVSGHPTIRTRRSNNNQHPTVRRNPTRVHMGTNTNMNGQRNASHGQQQQQQPPNNNAVQYPGRLELNQPFPRFQTDMQIRLIPLTEEPTNSEKGTKQNQDPIPELECAICMEFIESPSTCGSCTARFCRQCLTRAVMQSHACPGCRKAMPTPGDILSDTKFYEELARKRSDLNLAATSDGGSSNNGGGGGGILCPNLNCMQKVQPCNLRRHMKECEYTHVQCKYAPFGCKWTGPRKDVKDHYKIGCHLHRVEPLIETIRQVRASHQAHLQMMDGQVHMERQATMRMNHQNYLLQVKDRENWIHMMQMIHSCMCAPRSFLIQAVIWRDFWNCPGIRALSDNFICLLPLALWIMKHSLMGYRYLSRLFNPQNDEELQLALWDEVIVATCTAMLGVLFFACFALDKTPKKWSAIPLKFGPIDTTYPVRDTVMATSIFLFMTCFELENQSHEPGLTNYKGIFMAVVVQLSLLFRPFVQGMLYVAAEIPLPNPDDDDNTDTSTDANSHQNKILSKGRAFGVIQMSLVIGTLIPLLGLVEVFQAAWIFVQIEQELFKQVESFEMLKIIINNGKICAVMSMYSAYTLWVAMPSDEEVLTFCLRKWFGCFLALVGIMAWNFFAVQIDKIGNKAAIVTSRLLLQSMRGHPRSRLMLQNRIGSVAFYLWISLLFTVFYV